MSDLFEASGAEFSSCRTWRYRLWRTWDASRPPLVMIMLNPSKADEVRNDPTVERCERRARNSKVGFGGLLVLNIFAFVATLPDDMLAAQDPVGPGNDDALRAAFGLGAPVYCAAWGADGNHRGRDLEVAALARAAGVELSCLSVTKAGQPGHPLYLKSEAPFLPWRAS